ncbi:MAG: hypothetical protein KatS3mg131_1149 [Candidatus Tectimicrobiota bacterium]|nr:MAG: hypothetical protein KatS3mg131_1149 [Candidatus Tectomicrobia bacterium]
MRLGGKGGWIGAGRCGMVKANGILLDVESARMCLLMVIHRYVRDYPLVLAANRDEYYDRPAQGPQRLATAPAVWGGRDLRAGGTWLGVNAHGLVVGLTNRRLQPEQENDPRRRSRGLLCLEALRCRSAAEAAAWLAQQPPDQYNPCNLMLVDAHQAFWVAYEGKATVQALAPGVHLLANGNLNDVTTARIQRARHLLQRLAPAPLAAVLPLLEAICRDHEAAAQEHDTICLHRAGGKYGTVSSTILAVAPGLRHSVYRYAAGPPCRAPYQDYSSLFADAP